MFCSLYHLLNCCPDRTVRDSVPSHHLFRSSRGFRFRPRRIGSENRLSSWRAEWGTEIPNPAGFWEGARTRLLQTIQDRGLFISQQHPVVAADAEAEAETRVYFSQDRTINPGFPGGELSNEAMDYIEQFSWLNGPTVKKNQVHL